ncbi:AAA family ATPase [Celeribacter baekdonensis]|uniref:AAA family ATPase n=1 Tax=Celeribacter baekdonensis TaxID=875171 RepID=UPI0026EC40E3|nr:MoxR family ATPase [Celeribacter baekdonensis]
MQTLSEANSTPDGAIIQEIEAAGEKITRAKNAIGEIIYGQEQVIDQTLITVLAGGHALLVGVPGLAKTLLVHTIGIVLGLEDKRVQFTPDLMPADILGSEVLEEGEGGKRSFRFLPGPVFCQLLMADEINRASPRTQSALLQAMQEKSVTIAGQPHDLEAPFHVLATQNPLEQEGTYPLPEAQLDRFLVQVDVAYPDRDTERDILIATTGAMEEEAHAVFTAEELIKAQALLRKMPVGEQVVEMILDLVRACRPHEPEATPAINASVAWGPGPRAAQALMLTIRARALLDGRLAPSPEDVIAMAKPVLIHRMAMTFAARARGEDLASIIDTVAATLSENRSAA